MKNEYSLPSYTYLTLEYEENTSISICPAGFFCSANDSPDGFAGF
jgi:hypothetical protein